MRDGGNRHSQSTMPYHEIGILLGTHLGFLEVIWNVGHHQVVVDVGLHVAGEVVLREVIVELGLYFRIFRYRSQRRRRTGRLRSFPTIYGLQGSSQRLG